MEHDELVDSFRELSDSFTENAFRVTRDLGLLRNRYDFLAARILELETRLNASTRLIETLQMDRKTLSFENAQLRQQISTMEKLKRSTDQVQRTSTDALRRNYVECFRENAKLRKRLNLQQRAIVDCNDDVISTDV